MTRHVTESHPADATHEILTRKLNWMSTIVFSKTSGGFFCFHAVTIQCPSDWAKSVGPPKSKAKIMLPNNRLTPSETIVEIRERITCSIESLLQQSHTCESALAQTKQVGELIDALPFATEQYGLAKNRLRNAVRYYLSNEIGAARYELRLVIGQLGKTFA